MVRVTGKTSANVDKVLCRCYLEGTGMREVWGSVRVCSESAVSTSISIRSVIVSELLAVTVSSEEAGSVSVSKNRACAC